MAFNAFVSIKGTKLGQCKGDSTNPGRKDWSNVLAFSFDVISPRDPDSGFVSGRRHYKPVSFLKQWDAASPLLAALVTNEVLQLVVFEFERVARMARKSFTRRSRSPMQRWAEVSQYTPGSRQEGRHSIPADIFDLERVHLTFETIEVANNDGQTLFTDDWQ